MPWGSRQVYQTFPVITQIPSPTCVGDGMVQFNTGNDQWSRPEVAHRVKPTGQLWRYPTSRGPFYEYAIRYPIESYPASFSCNGNRYRRDDLGCPQFSAPTTASTNWPWGNLLANWCKNLRVNLASDLAEYDQALHAATGVAEGLNRGVRIAKGIILSGGSLSSMVKLAGREWSRGKKPRHWRDVPATWLGLNLAVLPTLGTLQSAIDKLNSPNSARPILRVYRTGHTTESHDGEITDMWGKKMEGHYLSRVRERVLAVVELTPNKSLWSDNFTPGNPLEWAWEKIPLSFVLDWFIPVGNYLSCLDAYSGISNVWGTYSARTRVSVRGARRPGVVVRTPGMMTYSAYNRTAFTSPPPLTRPRWSPHPSLTKLTTALSLLATQTGHLGRS